MRIGGLLADVDIETVQGRATFIALASRYVDLVADVAQNIIDLLEDKLDMTEEKVAPRSSQGKRPELPYSVKDHVIRMVRSVWDCDRDSDQNTRCMFGLRQLFSCFGRALSQPSSTERSRADHRRLLSRLLGSYDLSKRFETLDAGSAMMAIAANPQGVRIKVECVLEERLPSANKCGATTRTLCDCEGSEAFIVYLWRTRPPQDIARELNMSYQGLQGDKSKSARTRGMAIVGGAVEIFQMVPLQLQAKIAPEDSLSLWQRGIEVGEQATRNLEHSKAALDGPHPLFIHLSPAFLSATVDEAVATHARDHISGRRLDKRAPLARKAAMIIHEIYAQKEYNDTDQFRAKMNLVLVAIIVGCIKSQVRNRQDGDELEISAWIFDFQEKENSSSLRISNPLDLCEKFVVATSIDMLLESAACIWGGSTFEYHGNRYLPLDVIRVKYPFITLVFDIIGDIEYIASHGLSSPCIQVPYRSCLKIPRAALLLAVLRSSSVIIPL